MYICWALAQRYAWATPDAVMRLTYPQLHMYCMNEYERKNPRRNTVWLPAAEAVELDKKIQEKLTCPQA